MIKEINALNGVLEFHKTFDHLIGDKPSIPSKEVQELRINLLQEELNELKKAFEDNNLVEVADALIDLQYVLSGAIISCGLHNIASKLFDEVQRSNMSKSCIGIDDANATVEYYTKERGFDCFIIDKGNNIFHVKKSLDNKQLKSINYSPADLKPIIDNNL